MFRVFRKKGRSTTASNTKAPTAPTQVAARGRVAAPGTMRRGGIMGSLGVGFGVLGLKVVGISELRSWV